MLKTLIYAGCFTGLLGISALSTAAETKSHTWEDGSTYSGEWQGDQPNGYGTLTLVSGGRYTGMFKLGFPHGKGNYQYANGDVYDGQWKNGQHHGYGTLTYDDGSRYKGNFVNGERQGKGSFTSITGLTYTGPFEHDMANGIGVCTKDGKSEPCEYRKNKRHRMAEKTATNNYQPPQMLPAQTNARVAILDVKRLTKDQLEGRANRIPGTKSIDDLNKTRSDIFFISSGVKKDFFEETPIAWWQRRPSIFGDVLDVLSVHGDTEIHLMVEDYKGPGTYIISQANINSPDKALRANDLSDAIIIVEKEQKGWVSGTFHLTLSTEDGQKIRLEHGVFRLNGEAPSPRL